MLIPIFGFEGAAIATACSYVIMFLIGAVFMKKIVKITLPVLPWVKLIFVFIILFSIKTYFFSSYSPTNFIDFVIYFSVFLVFYAVLLLAFRVINFKEVMSIIREIL